MTAFNNSRSSEPVEMELSPQVEVWPKECPVLQIELLEDTSGGCVARMSGHLVGRAASALWSIEPMMANEVQVVLDLSGVVTIDGAGLEATVRLMDAIRGFGGRLIIGTEKSSLDGEAESFHPGGGEYRVSEMDSLVQESGEARPSGMGVAGAWARAIATTDRMVGGSPLADAGKP